MDMGHPPNLLPTRTTLSREPYTSDDRPGWTLEHLLDCSTARLLTVTVGRRSVRLFAANLSAQVTSPAREQRALDPSSGAAQRTIDSTDVSASRWRPCSSGSDRESTAPAAPRSLLDDYRRGIMLRRRLPALIVAALVLIGPTASPAHAANWTWENISVSGTCSGWAYHTELHVYFRACIQKNASSTAVRGWSQLRNTSGAAIGSGNWNALEVVNLNTIFDNLGSDCAGLVAKDATRACHSSWKTRCSRFKVGASVHWAGVTRTVYSPDVSTC
jgi:hypothetical protein